MDGKFTLSGVVANTLADCDDDLAAVEVCGWRDFPPGFFALLCTLPYTWLWVAAPHACRRQTGASCRWPLPALLPVTRSAWHLSWWSNGHGLLSQFSCTVQAMAGTWAVHQATRSVQCCHPRKDDNKCIGTVWAHLDPERCSQATTLTVAQQSATPHLCRLAGTKY